MKGKEVYVLLFEKKLHLTPFTDLLSSDIPFKDLGGHTGGTVYCSSSELVSDRGWARFGGNPDLDIMTVHRRDIGGEIGNILHLDCQWENGKIHIPMDPYLLLKN